MQTKNPKQAAFQFAKDTGAVWLRQSTDKLALTGYHELALELSKIQNLAAIFIPTSSGTTAQGLEEGFQKLGLNPQIHIVQTDAIHPMVEAKNNEQITMNNKEKSLATAIVDKVGFRKTAIAQVLKTSHGSGWIATNTQIVQAQKLIKQTTGVEISPNSALAIVGLTEAIKNGWHWDGPVVCLITGK